MNYPKMIGFPKPMSVEFKGIGDEPNGIVARKANACFVSRHKKYRKSQQDEHDRFMPIWYNDMNMPVNVKD